MWCLVRHLYWACPAFCVLPLPVLRSSCPAVQLHCRIATVFMMAVAMMGTWYDLMWQLGFMSTSMGEILFGKDDIVCLVEGARVLSLWAVSGFVEVWVRINCVHVRVSAGEAVWVWFVQLLMSFNGIWVGFNGVWAWFGGVRVVFNGYECFSVYWCSWAVIFCRLLGFANSLRTQSPAPTLLSNSYD